MLLVNYAGPDSIKASCFLAPQAWLSRAIDDTHRAAAEFGAKFVLAQAQGGALRVSVPDFRPWRGFQPLLKEKQCPR